MKTSTLLSLALTITSTAGAPSDFISPHTGIKAIGSFGGVTAPWKAVGEVATKKSFKDIGLECTNVNLDHIFKVFRSHEAKIEKYLEDWYEGFVDKKDFRFGEKNFGFFPDVFAKSHDVTFDGSGCGWDRCTYMGCAEAEARGMDPRVWLVMTAVGNIQSKLTAFNNLLTEVGVTEYLKNSDLIVKEAIKNIHIPQSAEKDLSLLSMLGAGLAGGAAFGGPASALLGVIPATMSVWGASFPFHPEFEAPWDRDDVMGSVKAGIGAALETFSQLARTSFSEVIMKANVPILPQGPRDQMTFSNKIEGKTGYYLATYLKEEAWWKQVTGSPEDGKKAMGYIINRTALGAALQASRHFLVRNSLPKNKKLKSSEWVANCNKIAGGWADEGAGICYTLQGMRSDGSWPFADNAAIGKMIKEENNIFGINSIADLYQNIHTCSMSCDEAVCGKLDSKNSMKVWAKNNFNDARVSGSKLSMCAVPIPVLDKDSVCEDGKGKKFPYEFDIGHCDMHQRIIHDRRVQDGVFRTTPRMAEFNAGKIGCAEKNNYNEKLSHKFTIACSN
ncbi:hypothetical protein EX30DRAFT_362362 [Ascodesmis nigricans]|uniref:Uncharacterized protein n=1 Tax=Ascodesmis nigricans TaxID=341454 RepID=A0A4S2N0T2_9PEZI|nr:hypothetical protein EX30DRAFT_362362 [Ascodesmis nigricans]